MQNAHLKGSQQFRDRERGELSASTPIGWTLLPLSVSSTHAASLHPGRHVHSCATQLHRRLAERRGLRGKRDHRGQRYWKPDVKLETGLSGNNSRRRGRRWRPV
jgi:hypothetical protein